MEIQAIRDLLSWSSLLQILALIYAGIEFLHTNKNLKYLYKRSKLPQWTLLTIGIVIFLNLLSDISPVLRQQEAIALPFQLPEMLINGLLLKIVAIFMLTALITYYFIVTLRPQVLQKQLNYKEKDPDKFLDTVFHLLKFNMPITTDNYRLVCILLVSDNNLKNILSHLTQWMPKESQSKEYRLANELLNYTLADKGFLNYLTSEDRQSLLKILGIIKESKATECHQFIRKLSSHLLSHDSLLDIELDRLGDGVYNYITEGFYSEPFFYNNYSLFDISYNMKGSDYNVLKKLTTVMESSINDYFSNESNQFGHSLNNPYHFGLEFLVSEFRTLISKLAKQGDYYDDATLLERLEVTSFFQHLEFCLSSNEHRKVKLSEPEQTVAEHTLTEDIAKCIFELVDITTRMEGKDGQEQARSIVMSLDWIWGRHHPADDVHTNLNNRILELFDTRIKENIKGKYSPMVRVLLSLVPISEKGNYGTSVLLYKYKSQLQPLLEDPATQERFKPISWVKDEKGNWIYADTGLLEFEVSK